MTNVPRVERRRATPHALLDAQCPISRLAPAALRGALTSIRPALAGLGLALAAVAATAQSVPDLAGIYTGRRCATSGSDVCPEMNLEGAARVLNARGMAFANAFDELAAPKYDCWPATLPIIFGDPYAWQIEQLDDRVIFAYEKDDVVRTIWLEGHGHPAPGPGDFFIHGHSIGRYEGSELVVETMNFIFDPGGLAGDYLSAPSSTQKRLVERYYREGEDLSLSLTVEDPIFLRVPIELVMNWQASAEPLSLPWDCDATAARRNLKVVPTKYPEDPAVVPRSMQR